MTFQAALKQYATLTIQADEASEALNQVAGSEKGPLGLTPDHIKVMPEYRAAVADFRAKQEAAKSFCKAFLKAYKKEYHVWFREMRAKGMKVDEMMAAAAA